MANILTPYAKAWAKFRGSDEYKRLRGYITDVGDPYASNRIRAAFDAGWNAKTSLIMDALGEAIKQAPPAKEGDE